ncbi:Zinc finger, C2H2-like [Lasallia pustulata]|uniref:Zinc finger, C2H2-like n=1 Tax=Lasallia pustulata TaxID=136370 RepID=A0A1W5DA26_9LECA|nr:Zinc finger, C2H2-like [Lasallia pustulata]
MAGRTSPINIATSSRHSSASPRVQQTSNLTTALHSTTGNESRLTSAVNIAGSNSKGFTAGFGRSDSMGGTNLGVGTASQYGTGAQPMSMNIPNHANPRRESVAGSLVGGLSWGGVSVGSFIRDDILMQGTSPTPFPNYQSPSFHSSSYLPKLEASFMRDFSCCGNNLPTLHDLLQHYEESHAQQMPPPLQRQQSSQTSAPPDSKAAIAAGAAAGIQQQAQQQQQQIGSTIANQIDTTPNPSSTSIPRNAQQHPQFKTEDLSRPLPAVQDMDAVDDMEMDDVSSSSHVGFSSNNVQQTQYPLQSAPQITQRSHFGQPARVPPLDMNPLNMPNPLQTHQGLRNSQPSTPTSAVRSGHPFQHNPTVSSVNTPTMTTHPLQQQPYRNTPDSSAPGTPAELDTLDTDFVGHVGNMQLGSNQQFMKGNDGAFGYGNGNDMLDLCIDEPAKRLFSPNGGGLNNPQQYAQFRLGTGQYGPNSELARRIREQQMMAGLADTASGVNGEEPKPFRCPVIGCEKAYKNQNGLKYHKSHGHNNQQLHENADGTFSIVNPETSVPYPGTLGMEKEKPYRCDVCGKRYKNLNGLKYHNAHSPPWLG